MTTELDEAIEILKLHMSYQPERTAFVPRGSIETLITAAKKAERLAGALDALVYNIDRGYEVGENLNKTAEMIEAKQALKEWNGA